LPQGLNTIQPKKFKIVKLDKVPIMKNSSVHYIDEVRKLIRNKKKEEVFKQRQSQMLMEQARQKLRKELEESREKNFLDDIQSICSSR